MRDEASRLVQENYFRWMVRLIFNPDYMTPNRCWMKLFRLLHEREFIYTIEMDGNRADDGIELRYRYGWERQCSLDDLERYLGTEHCSILEMMVALAHRCEESIMDNSQEDRTGVWFFDMIESLGLADQDDAHFHQRTVDAVLDDFLQHRYQADGKGGLFTIRDSRVDMRNMEIWYQMNRYLIENERR